MTKCKPKATTEEGIIEAARTIFAHKGFAATRTRDIAAAAGVNLALINYYFRSKEHLYHIITLETLKRFRTIMTDIIDDSTTTLEQKLEKLAANYIDLFLEQPDIPSFVMNEIGKDPSGFVSHIGPPVSFTQSTFYKQLSAAMKEGKIQRVDPLHLLLNIAALAIFPFAIAPMFQHRMKMRRPEFDALMLERKRLIPEWIKAMLEVE
jgi:AcrR family transcriptional regulator